jgi:mutator protein MutT
MKSIRVSCAIIEEDGKVLSTQRSETMSLPLKWEFPGGKIKEGELPDQCLKRELHEELGIEVAIGRSLSSTTYQYATFIVTLYPFICRIIAGNITLHEHKTLAWLHRDKLYELDWAEADLPVINEYIKTCLKRAYYSDTIVNFMKATAKEIVGQLTISSYSVEEPQTYAWSKEISLLHESLGTFEGKIYFEYTIPRMGRRIDVILVIGAVIFVLEFKVGEKEFALHSIDQVYDYALDLKNFHEPSHSQYIAPILIATKAKTSDAIVAQTPQNDKLLLPIKTNGDNLIALINHVLRFADGEKIDPLQWEQGRYHPTPTIIEAAMALYNNHSVADISRTDASAINLSRTSAAISEIIRTSREKSCKSICFVTGVPGAGKTLVGLNIATTHINDKDKLYSVFLSGNGPLVAILREALARDKIYREKEKGRKIWKGEAISDVKMFIQNVHHFRDECLRDLSPPIEHVALFDEAQRAWNLEQTSAFMLRKKKRHDFNQSEPEFLVSCLDRHPDWAVVICLVGGGQEINTGEAGIGEWVESLNRSFPDWHVYVSPRLTDSEYGAGDFLKTLSSRENVIYKEELHLAVSMRSFRAEHVSLLVKQILDLEMSYARTTLDRVKDNYPIVLTRDLGKAKQWLRTMARGTERFGIVVSSQAERLKPHAIDVKSPMDPIHWFLDGKEDVRSSYYLEDVATEFHVQGLELDWACVTWDADFRFSKKGWEHWSFSGSRWKHINQSVRRIYQKNAYRVLLTRARQGMVIVVPPGEMDDPTRNPDFYNSTYEYLKEIGFQVL